MKTVFDPAVREEIIGRIRLLTLESRALWGKMNLFQMTRHCVIWDEWVQGTHKPVYKQMWLGKIFGKAALKRDTKDARPLPKNVPTGNFFIVKEKTGDAEGQKAIWISRVNAYADYNNPTFLHDFFGRMTPEQIGIFAYKHADHHLRQFGV